MIFKQATRVRPDTFGTVATPCSEVVYNSYMIGGDRSDVLLPRPTDATVAIPMRGTATSLNAAVATSIVLYELDASRRGAS